MGEFTTIMARDGHEFQAWLSAAPGQPRGALVVLQEIFGVNSHIRAVAGVQPLTADKGAGAQQLGITQFHGSSLLTPESSPARLPAM